jgi:2-amino-4-hydroxy-6-hydroxymethyldihydropteridine diphosphokinase
MKSVVLDLGTNIDREESLVTAFEHLADHFTLVKASSVFRTVPVGMSNQPDFYNVSLEINTDKSLAEIRSLAREIEDKMGRDRTGPKFGPRNIDIDVVLYEDLVDGEEDIPHPQSTEELFMVAPLADLKPDGKHPKTGETWKELRGKLMEGRSEKDAGILKQCRLSDLPLGEKAKRALLIER